MGWAPPRPTPTDLALIASAASGLHGRGARTAARLVEATLRCLARDGYSRLSVENIVAEAGVSRGALFHHFETKQELVADAMATFLDESAERLNDDLQAIGVDERGRPASLIALTEALRQDSEVILEIAVALRTDKELHASVSRARMHENHEEMQLSHFFEGTAGADAIGRAAVLIAIICGARACEIITSGPTSLEHNARRGSSPARH